MKALRLVLLGIAMAVFAGLIWRTGHPSRQNAAAPPIPTIVASPTAEQSAQPATTTEPAASGRPASSQAGDASQARGEVISRMADAPDYQPFFERYRADFPSDYTALIDDAADAVAKGAHAPNPDRLMIEAVRGLKQSKGILAAQAEDGPLDSLFQAQAALVDALAQASPHLCVDFLYGGISPTFMAFAATHRDLVERLAISNLSAISSGRQNHVERAQPSNEDFDALTSSLQSKGLSADEISALLDGKTFDPPLPETRLCEAGLTYLHALEALPDAVKLRLYALSAALPARS